MTEGVKPLLSGEVADRRSDGEVLGSLSEGRFPTVWGASLYYREWLYSSVLNCSYLADKIK